MDIKLFNTKRAQLLKQAISVYERQHRAISQNVAQANNPNYTRVNTDFSETLRAAVDQSKIKTTNDKHIRASHFDKGADNKLNNSKEKKVDLTREMTELAENQIRYEFVTRILNRYYNGLGVSITGRN